MSAWWYQEPFHFSGKCFGGCYQSGHYAWAALLKKPGWEIIENTLSGPLSSTTPWPGSTGHNYNHRNHDNHDKVGEGRGRELLQLDEGEEGQVTKLQMIIIILVIMIIMMMIMIILIILIITIRFENHDHYDKHHRRLFGMSATYIVSILQSFWSKLLSHCFLHCFSYQKVQRLHQKWPLPLRNPSQKRTRSDDLLLSGKIFSSSNLKGWIQ